MHFSSKLVLKMMNGALKSPLKKKIFSDSGSAPTTCKEHVQEDFIVCYNAFNTSCVPSLK